MRTFIVYTGLGLLTFVVNFLIYSYSFNQQATPFLHEEQRVDSALIMLKTTVPAFFVAAVISTLGFYYVAKLRCRR